MSDATLLETRGVPGLPVAAKAAMLMCPRKSRLLYFLQSLSMRMGGMARVAEDFLAMFPERIGTPTMHKAGIKEGLRYSPEVASEISEELHPGRQLLSLAFEVTSGELTGEPPEDRAVWLLEQCRQKAGEELEGILTSLCVNPRITLYLPGENEARFDYERRKLADLEAGLSDFDIGTVRAIWFRDLAGALLEYQERYAARVAGEFVATSISKEVFAALDYGLRTRKMVLLEGNSGVGKSESVKAWCAMHQGEARHVSLSGICNRTTLFRDLARALGVGVGAGYSASKTQVRVEDFLERSRLMLVLDEAQYIFPQQERVYAHPELVNWLLTACHNRGVPVALVATKEFARRRQAVERQTTWSSEQLSRRITRYFPLPEVPTKEDLEAVARKLLPGAGRKTVDYLVGYAMTSGRYLPALGEVISDAQMLAQADGRNGFTLADLMRAVTEIRGPSDAAQRRVFEVATPLARGRKARPASVAEGIPALPSAVRGSGSAKPLQTDCTQPSAPALAAARNNEDFAEVESARRAAPVSPSRVRFDEPVPA